MKTLKLTIGSRIPDNFTGIIEYENGAKEWYKNGRFHREDGPAKIRSNGFKEWWLDGEFIYAAVRGNLNKDKIILSKDPHPLYPTVQVWKYIDAN